MTEPLFTTTLAVDARTIQQLLQVWPTWCRHHPEILTHPQVVMVDMVSQPDASAWAQALERLPHPNRRVIPWTWPDWLTPYGASLAQRERMLTAFVRAHQWVDTEYMLKLDSDVVGLPNSLPLYEPDWFENKPALCASPWGYTKPGDWIDQLQTWGDNTPGVKQHERLPLEKGTGVLRFSTPGRIISWLCLTRTEFCEWASDLAPDRLPVPSQDTYLWYLAARTGEPIKHVRFKKRGWEQTSRQSRREELIKEVLQ